MQSSDDDSQDNLQEAETWEDWSDGESEGLQSLCSARTFGTAEELFQFDAAEFGFDLREFRRQVRNTCCVGFSQQHTCLSS